MADPYEQFADAPNDDPYAAYQDVPPRPKRVSQAQGFAKGFVEPLARLEAGVEAGLDRVGIPASKLNRATMIGGKSAGETNEAVKNVFARREAGGVSSGPQGEFLGGLAASVPIMLATRNPWAGGAASGAFLSKADDLEGTAMDAGFGAIGGKLGDVVVGKVAGAIKPVLAEGVEKLTAGGVRLTAGQARGGKALVREDKAMSLPFVGEKIADARQMAADGFRFGTFDKALAPLGLRAPRDLKTPQQVVDWAQSQVGAAYDEIVPNLRVKPDARMTVGMRKVVADLETLPKDAQQQFVAMVKRSLGNTPTLAGQQLKNTQSELGQLAMSYSKSPNAWEQQLGRMVGGVKAELDSLIERQNPEFGKELRRVNQAFRGLAIAEDAAKRAADGNFSPAQLRQAAVRGDSTRRQKASAAGKAYMQDWAEAGINALSGRTPNSGTADRSPNIVSYVRGALGSMAYPVDNAFNALRLTPRPPGAGKVADAVRNTGRRVIGPVSGNVVSKRERE